MDTDDCSSNTTTTNDVKMSEEETTTTPSTATTTTPNKRKRLTEEEKKIEKQKKEEEKQKKEAERKKLAEEKEIEKKKKEEELEKKRLEKKKRDEEKEIQRKKREEETEKRKEEKELEKKKKEEELEKKRLEKKKKEEELEKKKEEQEKRKEEHERKKEEAERLKEEEEKKQQKLTSFFAPVHTPVKVKANSTNFIQPIELPPYTQLYQYSKPEYSSDDIEFIKLINSNPKSLSLPKDQQSNAEEKRNYFKSLNKGTPMGKKGQRNFRFKMQIKSLPGSIMHHDLVSKLSVLKLLKFHDSFRPSYYGTYSKQSKLITGKNPMKRDNDTIDYDYDSSDEWEEEKDDDQAEKITSADEKDEDIEEEEEDEEDKEWIENVDDDDEEDNINDEVTSGSSSNAISANEKVHTRRNKKRRIVEKKPIIIQPYFNEYPILPITNNNSPNVNNNNNNSNDSSNNSLEFLRVFTVEPLDILPIKLEKPIEHTTSTKEDFPIKALPTFLYIIKENKLSFKKLVDIFTEHFPIINQRQIKEKLNEHCIYNHRTWVLKPESELILTQTPIDPLYPIPAIPKSSPTKKELKEKEEKEQKELKEKERKEQKELKEKEKKEKKEKEQKEKELLDQDKSPSKGKSKKKPIAPPVQSKSLLNYFTKIETTTPTTTAIDTNNIESDSIDIEMKLI